MFDFLEDESQPLLALSEESRLYPWFEDRYGGLDRYVETRDPSRCFHPLNPDYVRLEQAVNGLPLHESFIQREPPPLDGYFPSLFYHNAYKVPTAWLGSFAMQYGELPWLTSGRFEPKGFMRVGKMPKRLVTLLTGNSQDPSLEEVWLASYTEEFWRSLRGVHNPVLISPDFSLYTHYTLGQTWCQGRFEQVWNMKRSLDFCHRATKRRLVCALLISYATRRDLENWCRYLREEGSGISLLSLNIQTQPETACDQPRVILSIEKAVGRKFRWIIQGIGSETAFRAFHAAGLLNRVSFICASEQSLAIYRKDANRKVQQGADPRRLLVANIIATRERLARIKAGVESLPFDMDDAGLQMTLPNLNYEPHQYLL